jgi:hypothetical protein
LSSTDATHDKRDVVVLAGFVLRESDLVATLDVIDRAEIAVLRRDDGHVRLDELSGDIGSNRIQVQASDVPASGFAWCAVARCIEIA